MVRKRARGIVLGREAPLRWMTTVSEQGEVAGRADEVVDGMEPDRWEAVHLCDGDPPWDARPC